MAEYDIIRLKKKLSFIDTFEKDLILHKNVIHHYNLILTCNDGLENGAGCFADKLGFLLENGRLLFDLLPKNPKLSLVGQMLCFFCPFLDLGPPVK